VHVHLADDLQSLVEQVEVQDADRARTLGLHDDLLDVLDLLETLELDLVHGEVHLQIQNVVLVVLLHDQRVVRLLDLRGLRVACVLLVDLELVALLGGHALGVQLEVALRVVLAAVGAIVEFD